MINSGNYHNDLDKGLDRAYLMERIMPSIHSGCSTTFTRASLKHISTGVAPETMHDLKMLAGDQDRKEIYSFCFALSPESDNPSGHLNFSSGFFEKKVTRVGRRCSRPCGPLACMSEVNCCIRRPPGGCAIDILHLALSIHRWKAAITHLFV